MQRNQYRVPERCQQCSFINELRLKLLGNGNVRHNLLIIFTGKFCTKHLNSHLHSFPCCCWRVSNVCSSKDGITVFNGASCASTDLLVNLEVFPVD